MGGALHFLRGAPEILLPRLAQTAGATKIFWTRRYGGAEIALDSRLKENLLAQNIDAKSFDGALLAEPWTVKTGAGGPFKVFTPFWRALQGRGGPPLPRPAPARMDFADGPPGERLADWRLLPTRS